MKRLDTRLTWPAILMLLVTLLGTAQITLAHSQPAPVAPKVLEGAATHSKTALSAVAITYQPTLTSSIYFPIIVKPEPPAITITKFEITQSIQNEENTVPLIAGRPTLVRVYAESSSGAPLPDQAITLTASRNGALLGEVSLVQTVPITPDRGDYDSTFNFILPEPWLSGTVQLTADGQMASHSTEVSFNEVPPLLLKIVPINYNHTGSTNPDFYPGSFEDKISDWVMRAYPLPEIQVSFLAGGYTFRGDLKQGTQWNTLLNTVTTLKQTEGGATGEVWYGFIPTRNETQRWWNGGIAGLGWVGGGLRTSVGLDIGGQTTATVAAHEIGHNFGRPHAPCGVSGSDWPDDPKYNNAMIGEYAVDGILSGTPDLLKPTQYKDLMSYCSPQWLSDWTYVKLYNDQRANGALLRQVERPTLLIRADLSADSAINLHPVYTLSGVPTDLPDRSLYRVELLGLDQQVIASHFLPVIEAEEPGVSAQAIHALLPAPDTEVAAIRLLTSDGARRIERTLTRTRSTLPTPTVVQTREAITLTWGLADQPAMVRYTHDDGQTWTAVAADVTGGEIVLDPDILPGGQGRFEIMLADRDVTLTATLETPLPNRPPRAWISGPTLVETGAFATLYGYGTDLEDGPLTKRRWHIDGQPVEAGRWLSLHDLSPGEYVITVTVTDSAGQSATGSHLITVTP